MMAAADAPAHDDAPVEAGAGDGEQRADTDGRLALEDLDDRVRRALTGPMAVDAYDPGAWGEGEAYVYSGRGRRYLVNALVGYCECPDHEHRNVRCKHYYRAAIRLGELPVPNVDPDVIEGTLRAALERQGRLPTPAGEESPEEADR